MAGLYVLATRHRFFYGSIASLENRKRNSVSQLPNPTPLNNRESLVSKEFSDFSWPNREDLMKTVRKLDDNYSHLKL
jgi:hypothetical protein